MSFEWKMGVLVLYIFFITLFTNIVASSSLSALGLCCSSGSSLVAASRGSSLIMVCPFLMVVVSLREVLGL